MKTKGTVAGYSFALIILIGGGLILRQISISDSVTPSDSISLAKGTAPRNNKGAPLSEIENCCALLTKSQESSQTLTLLKQLRRNLEELGPEKAAEFVSSYLKSGQDSSLPLPFKITPEGQLETAPTIRTALLDHLGKINPEAAAAISKGLLSSPTHPDEWAIALRNVARIPESAQKFLQEKTEELILNPEWQASPSVGYLNAFDVLVHTRATEAAPFLSDFLKNKERPDLARASFLTLDRLTQLEPVTMLATLLEDSNLHQARPGMVAQQFARAQLSDPAQRELVEQWLLSEYRTQKELQTFTESYPNLNQIISNNLLTSNKPSNLTIDLRATSQIINEWKTDPRFEPTLGHLDTLEKKLIKMSQQEP